MQMSEMTLLHHIAFDGNIEAFKMMTTLPYFKEIVDCDSNDVIILTHFIAISMGGLRSYGLPQDLTFLWLKLLLKKELSCLSPRKMG
jgi:hypothetical protein